MALPGRWLDESRPRIFWQAMPRGGPDRPARRVMGRHATVPLAPARPGRRERPSALRRMLTPACHRNARQRTSFRTGRNRTHLEGHVGSWGQVLPPQMPSAVLPGQDLTLLMLKAMNCCPSGMSFTWHAKSWSPSRTHSTPHAMNSTRSAIHWCPSRTHSTPTPINSTRDAMNAQKRGVHSTRNGTHSTRSRMSSVQSATNWCFEADHWSIARNGHAVDGNLGDSSDNGRPHFTADSTGRCNTLTTA